MSGHCQFEWALTLPAGDPVGLHVSFGITRTQVLLVLLDLDDGPPLVLGEVKGTSFHGIETPAVARAKRLRVHFDGNPPALAHVVWTREGVTESVPPVLPLDWDPKETPPTARFSCSCSVETGAIAVKPSRLAEALEQLSPSVVDLYPSRLQAIAWHARAQEFFLRMDMETEPSLVPPRWLDTIRRLGQRLQYRIEERACCGLRGGYPCFRPIVTVDSEDPFERSDLEDVSLFLVNLIRSGLENHGGDKLVAWAFEMFATDRLTVHHVDLAAHRYLKGHGAANGLLFLQFAELALACIENDIDRDFWLRYLPALVQATHAFLETARDWTTSPAREPAPQHYEFVDGRFHCRERLEELRDETELARTIAIRHGSSLLTFLEERFTSLVATAYPHVPGVPLVETRPIRPGHGARLKPRGCSDSSPAPAPPPA